MTVPHELRVHDEHVHSPPTLNALNHTLGHIKCPPCEKIRAELICTISSDLEFSAAGKQWLESRTIDAVPGAITARYIRKTTEDSYAKYIRTLELFFSGMLLRDIKLENLAAYQKTRYMGAEPFIRYRRPQDAKAKIKGDVTIPAKGKTSCPAKPPKIKQELNVLILLLRLANCWSVEDETLYKKLNILDEEEGDIPRALTYEEQRRWLDVARIKPEWNLVYWWSLLAFATCMSTDEIRGLRLGDINLFQRVIIVRRKTSKNKYRSRTIELIGADVLWALEQLMARAAEHGAKDPQHYLFPGRVHIGLYDPKIPMSAYGLNKYWNEVRQFSDLKWFRQYDSRHTAITRLAEAGVPTDVIMAMAGHVTEKMRKHYTHISQAAQRKWLEHAHGLYQPQRPQPQSAPAFMNQRFG
jgi:integrase